MIGGQHRIEQAFGAARRFLGDGADFPIARPRNLAHIGGEFTQDHFQQRRFAGAVAADQTDAAARRQIGGRAGDDLAAGDADGDVVETQHGGGAPNVSGSSRPAARDVDVRRCRDQDRGGISNMAAQSAPDRASAESALTARRRHQSKVLAGCAPAINP